MKMVLLVSCLSLFSACRSLRPIAENEYGNRIEQSRYENSDSVRVYIRDSIRIYEKGDTVRIECWRERYRTDVRFRTDSVYIRDSLYKQVPVAVAKPLNTWQKFLMKTGGISLILTVVGIGMFLLRLFLKRP